MDSDSSSDEGKMLIDVGRLEEGESSPSPVISASCSMETEAAEEEATKESEDADGAMATETANTNIEKEEEEGGSEEDDDDEDEDEEEDGEEDDGEEDDGEEEDDDDGEEDEEGDDDEDEEDEEEGEESPDGGTLLVEEDEDDDSPKCAICHGAFTTQDLGSPESCDHTFCLECILAWSRRVNTCPMDRSVFHLIFARHAGENAIYKKISVENQVQEEEEEEEDELADSFCQICQHGDREDVLLLCDGCDRGWHCDCLDPPLSEVPVNEWFCPLCRAQNEDLEEDEEETFLSRRQIPRTMASERVRASIRQARLARASMLIDSMSSEEDADAEAQPSTSSAAQRKTTPKKTTRKKKRKTTRKRKSTKRKRKTTKAGKRKSTGRKKGRRRKKRRTKTSKRPRLIDPLQVDPRQRIFRSLGLSRPPVGRTIPMQKMPICKPGDLGVSLSLLGDNNELHAYSDEQQMESGEVSVPAVPKRVSKYSVSALRSHRQVGRPILGDRVPTPNKEVSGGASDSAPSTSGSLSLLDSIIQGQDILHMQSHHITINRDGSLLAKSAPTQPPRKTDSKDDDKILTFCDLNTFNEKETSIEEKENVESSGDDVRLVKDSKEESVPVENVACSADEVKADEHAEESAEKLTEESVSQDNCDTDISHAKEESASAGSPERVNTDSQDSDISPPSPDAENVMENENEAERPETMGPVFSSISDADVTGDSQDAASPAMNESHPSRKSDGEIESSDSNQYIDGESSQPDVEEEPSQEAAGMEEDDNQDNTGEEGQVTSEEERGERNGEGENEDPDSKSTSAKENVGDIRKVVISSRDDSANAEPWHKESLLVQVEVKGKEGEEGLEDKEVEIVEPRKSPTPMVQIIISDSDDDRDRDDRPKVPISELPRIPKRKKGDDGGGSSASHSRGVLSRLDVDSKDYRSWEKRKGRHEGDREGRERSRGESRRHRDRSREERHTERSRDEGRHRHRRSERHSSRGHSYERHDEPGERERDRDRDRERHRSRSRDRSRRKRHERHERSRSREYERGEVERESRHKRKKRDRDRSREREAYRSRRSRSRSRSPRRRERSAADKVSHELDYYEKQNSNGSGRSEESHGHSSKRHSSDPMPFQDSKRSKLYSSRRVEHSPDKDTTGTPLADDNFSEGLSDDDQEEQEVLSDSNNKSSVKSASPPPPDRSERPTRAEAAPTAGGEPSEYDPAHPTEEDLERAGDQEDRRSHFPRNIPPPDAVLLQGGEQVPGMMGAAGDGGMISTQNIPLPGMAFNVLPPGMPPTMRPPVLVNPVLMNRPPPFRQLPPHMHGPPSRFSWAPGMPVPVRNQFPGQPMPHTQPGMGGMPPQPGMINGLMDPMGQDGGMGGPSHGQLQMQPVSSKGGFLPHPPAPPRMMGPGDGMKPSPQLEEISKLLNIPAFARRSGGKDDGLFKVPLPPQMAWKTEGAASRQGGREGGDPMESTEVVDMDMSPLDDECELELPVQAGAGMAATSADNLSKKLVNDLGKAIEKLSARQDDTPSSAVDLSNHQKFLEKVHMQERVVDEVKMAIKPFYASKSINKQEYKDIMRKAVPKICRCKSGRINPLKVKKLVEAYVEKCRRTHSQHSGHKEKKSGTPHKDAVKANGERQKVKSSR